MFRSLLVVAALLTAGQALAEDVNAPAPYALTAKEQADIVRQTKDQLLDGEAARWRWPLHQPPFGLYCGWVNAKNSYGAYVGWQPFMVIGGTAKVGAEYKVFRATIGSTVTDDIDMQVLQKMCLEKGYDLSGPPPE